MNLLDAGNGYFWLLTNIINTQSGNQVRIRKIDSVGNTHTTATHGNSTGDLYAYELIENKDNDMVFLANDLNGTATPMLYELDDVGAEIANYSYSQTHPTRAFGLDELPQGGYVFAGEFDNGADLGAIVIKTDDAFIEDYVFERDNADDEYFRDVIVDSTGAIAVGATENMGEGGFDGFIVHLDTLGDSVMTETLGRALDDVLMTATQSTQPKGGILAGGQSLGVGGNGYLIKAIKYGEIPCQLPRFLFVDGFVSGNRVSIDDANTILGDATKEYNLIQDAKYHNVGHLCLYGVNYLFEPGNANATRGGSRYDSLLNEFLTYAAREGISCAMMSVPDTGTSTFHSAGLYNLKLSVIHNNYKQAGKIDYFQLEHEFWNANGVVAKSGPTAIYDEKSLSSIPGNMRNTHFTSVYNDHKNFLDTLNTFRFNDANVLAVYDYIDRLFFNWDTNSTLNHYKDTNEIARSLKAKELEKRTNAIFLSHYRGHSSSYKSLRFLHYDSTSSTVKRFTKRLSFFGQNTRKTYLLPLFSGEYYNFPDSCGDGLETNFLGNYFRDNMLFDNDFHHVEDSFIYQYSGMKYDTSNQYIDNVKLSGFGWFKYTCLESLIFFNTDLNECPVYPLLLRVSPNKTLEDNNIIDVAQTVSSAKSIQPNPTTDLLSIHGLQKNAQVSVFDIKGKLQFQKISTENTVELSLIEFKPGIYFIEISEENSVETFKVVKQ